MAQRLQTRREMLSGSLGLLGERKPNVLFMSVDDLNDWVGVLGGHPQARTPNLDRLARAGMRFTRAYCQAPMCNPSRASLLTGLRPTTTGIYSNDDVWRDGAKGIVTLPEAFLNSGYRAECFGKIFHSKQTDKSCWNAYHEHPERIEPASRPGKAQRATKIAWGAFDGSEAADADPWVASRVVDFLRKPRSEPFFVGCGLIETHIPWFSPRRHFELFSPEKAILPPYRERDLEDVPRSAIREQAVAHHRAIAGSGAWREAVAAYLACIHYVDEQVGRVLDALDASPHRDNTIVVLWSDHGWHLGEKDHWQKFTLWERSCRVPLFVKAPGITKPESEYGHPVELLDLYPTLAELCGLRPGHALEGRSLVPLLRNPGVRREQAAITSNGFDKASVRTSRWRYSRFPDGEELYDHERDPHEWTNLAGERRFDAVRRELRGLLPPKPNRKPLRQFDELTPEEKQQIRGRPRG